MNEDKFDAIIVGGGLAGLSAAIVLARAGKGVIVIERGDYCGAKNMTGGRLYGHSLEKLIPGFAASAPIGANVAVYVQLHDMDYPYACQSVALSTVLSVVTLPALMALANLIL